jgi:hypothetical protein
MQVLVVALLIFIIAGALSTGTVLSNGMEQTSENRICSLNKNADSSDSQSQGATDTRENEIPALPTPAENGEPTRQLPLGSTVSMDHLGPIIVNTDGTTRRIANWNELTKSEQENAIRLISARNKRRIEALKNQQDGEQLS